MISKVKSAIGRFVRPRIHAAFFGNLIDSTGNFSTIRWLGYPVWQNVLDLWTIQEVIYDLKPDLLIECGTNRGGSSMFYAHLFDLMNHGHVVTIDVEKLHTLSHPRVTHIIGSSTEPDVVNRVATMVAQTSGPVLVILDSDHSERHVRRELDCYAQFVTPGSYCLVQDGVIDTQPAFSAARPGPLPAIESFLSTSNDFEIDEERCSRFLITHHPKGWLRRKLARRP